ncbi:RNA polymerase I associated factor, A49-like protein [Pseudomassariella vexata]|uniref:RNA polymerase I associated factor, A49-like protein n=1 Tax=Pseudomassariella vexata TaxID=1141098 RepID=A0A1Y2EDE1_9PEZI|nr:RNA polymerase I associated factor, A49-like protein [Pseudomassariella vexata]ORY69580.1 RNA polymerase I associated factor, A49-like protein [Pseudomassariella vexata]
MGERSEKKRKISEGESSRSRKKANIAAPSQPETIKVSSVKSVKSCPPVIATAPGLSIPSSIEFQAYAKTAPSTKRSKKPAPQLDSLFLHSSSHRTLDYTAREDGAAASEAHLRHYIGILDPMTGQLSVIEAKKMAVRGKVRAQQAPEDNIAERTASKTLMQQRTDLGEAFGTKKARKAIADITQNAISSHKSMPNADGKTKKLDASSMAIMESLQEVTQAMATREQLQAAVDGAKPVPPGNFDAEEIQDVYKPEDLIGFEILNAIPIKDWQDSIKKKENLETPFRFISSRIYPIAEGPNPAKRLKILRYLNFLFEFFKACKPGKARGSLRLPPKEKLAERLADAPQPVIESIRRKFSQNGDVSKFHIQLLRTYCCAIAAIVANYEFETSYIRMDMGLDEKEFAMYFREIGGKISHPVSKDTKGKMQFAKLALPLEFPKVRFMAPKRR